MAFSNAISLKDLLEMLPMRKATRKVAPDGAALLRLARALDEQGMTKEADRITQAMVRTAQMNLAPGVQPTGGFQPYNDQTIGGYYGQQFPVQWGKTTPGYVGKPTYVNPGGAIQSGMPVPEFAWGGGEVAPNRGGGFSFSPGSELGNTLGAMGTFQAPSSSQTWRLPGDRITFSNPYENNPAPYQALDMAGRASKGDRPLRDAYWSAMNSSDPQQVLRAYQEGSTAIPMRGAPGGGGLAFRGGTKQDLQGQDVYHSGTWQQPSALTSGPATSTGELQPSLPSRFDEWGGSQRPIPGTMNQLPYRPIAPYQAPSPAQPSSTPNFLTSPRDQVGVVSSRPITPTTPTTPAKPNRVYMKPTSRTKFRPMTRNAQLGWGGAGQYQMTPGYAQYQQPMGATNYQQPYHQGGPGYNANSYWQALQQNSPAAGIQNMMYQGNLQKQYQQNVNAYNQALRSGNQQAAAQIMQQQQQVYGQMDEGSIGKMTQYYTEGAGSPQAQAKAQQLAKQTHNVAQGIGGAAAKYQSDQNTNAWMGRGHVGRKVDLAPTTTTSPAPRTFIGPNTPAAPMTAPAVPAAAMGTQTNTKQPKAGAPVLG